MKRMIAGLLAVVLLVILSVAPAMAEEGATGSPASEETGETMEAAVVQSAAEPSFLEIDDLRAVLRNNNYNVKALEASMLDLNSQDSGDLWNAVIQMDQLKTGVQASQAAVNTALSQVEKMIEAAAAAGEDENSEVMQNLQMQKLVLSSLNMTLTADTASLQTQITTLQSQMTSIDTTIETTKNTLNDAINQIVKGAETLYIGIVTMESSVDALQRGLNAMDRAVAICEKQYELGMASQYDVETMEYQRSSLASQMESLLFQIETSKITLEGMCGLELRDTVRLGELPMPTQEELDAIDYDKDMPIGQRRNVDVMNAQEELDNESTTVGKHTLQAAKDTFAYNFKVLCMTVEEKDRLVGVAEEALAFQERTFEITAKQYELGMISQEEYLTGESDLLTAQESVNSAQLELFTAYRNYIWARDYGLI